MSVQRARRRFTVDEYHRMAEAGILSEDDRVELIEGEIVDMTAIRGSHLDCVNRLTRLLVTRVGARADVSVQNPIRLDRYSEPQPDLALLHPRPYAPDLPGPRDVFLLVEVADTSAAYDRQVKVPLYARAGILEVWLVDLEGQAVEVYREPAPAGYRNAQAFARGQQLSPLAFPEVVLTVDEMLG
ncbi:MAG: Uma2 family endonuclease [Armatimonadota bacterium]|nr:Uma2 family endonuclease [Armatimonadota bacterium]